MEETDSASCRTVFSGSFAFDCGKYGSNQRSGIPRYSGHFPVDVTLASIWKTSNNHTNLFPLFPPLGSTCLYLKMLSFQAEQVKDRIQNSRNCGQILFKKCIYFGVFLSDTIWQWTEKPWSAYSLSCLADSAGGGLANAFQLRLPLATSGAHDPIYVLSKCQLAIELLEIKQRINVN